MDPVKDKPFTAHHEHKEDSLGEQEHVNNWSTEGTKEYDPVFVKKTIRKLDMRLLIILGAMYSIALIDRTNLSSARVAGMNVELKNVGERYSIATLVFFIPYIIFEFPSNLLLRKIGDRNLLSSITILWGSLVGLRVILGFFEAGFFPGCVYLLSSWYTRWRTQTRISLFYLMSMFISGLSQILAYGLIQIPRAGYIHTWRWIFVVLGAFTIALGILSIFLIIDFPDKNLFLSAEETAMVIDLLNKDRGDAMPDQMTRHKVIKHLTCWRTWCYGLCFMNSTLPSYAFAYFLPVILAGQSYSQVAALCLSAPPYAAGAIYTFCVALSSDKLRKRGIFVILNAVVTFVGCLIIGYHKNKDVRYFGCFLAIMEAQANVPSVLAFQATNTVTHTKRSVSAAMVIGMGGVGGIIASTVYREADFPRYIPGLWATIGAQFFTIILVGLLTLGNTRYNRKLDAGEVEPIQGIEGFRYSI